MVSFNRLLLVIKQTAFDAYKAQEAIATAAGQAVFDPARMQSLARRHDTHMYQVDTLVPIRPRSRGERRSLRTFDVLSLRPGSLAFNPRPRRLSTPSDAFELRPDIALFGTTLVHQVDRITTLLRDMGVTSTTSVMRSEITREHVRDADLVVALGGDGTTLIASHLIEDDTPLLGETRR
jgi:hypothetical protein